MLIEKHTSGCCNRNIYILISLYVRAHICMVHPIIRPNMTSSRVHPEDPPRTFNWFVVNRFSFNPFTRGFQHQPSYGASFLRGGELVVSHWMLSMPKTASRGIVLQGDQDQIDIELSKWYGLTSAAIWIAIAHRRESSWLHHCSWTLSAKA